MGNQLKKLTTLTTNNNMFKNFASALALLAIGAYASIHEKPNAAGELSSKEAYKYGRFVASMKASKAMGSASAFALYDLESFSNDQNVFDNWNSFATVPSLVHNEEESVLYSKMSRSIGEEWKAYKDFTLDDNYHKFEIEWTPDHLVYKIDDIEIRRKEGVEALDKGLNLIMSICALDGEDTGAGRDDTEAHYNDFDYVEVYHYDAGEDSFWLNFRDDFDTYDQNRWVSADNKTWEGMDSNFKKENVEVKDGRLHLRLDKNADYHGDDDDHSGDDSHDDEDFHVLPAPKDGTLDAAIEKATRVGVVMVRQYLDNFASGMAHVLQ